MWSWSRNDLFHRVLTKKFDTTVKPWILADPLFVTDVDLEDGKISSGAPISIFACLSKTYSELKLCSL